MQNLTISQSPHIRGDKSVKKIMYGVIIALVPAFIISVLFFGMKALNVTAIAVISCVLFEYVIQKFVLKIQTTITDGSAIITGILLAFNVPSNLPPWIIILGSFVAIAIGKMSFGGLGNNPFNPALVSRVFLLISFPVEMTSWPTPSFMNLTVDTQTGATPLSIIKGGLAQGQTMIEVIQNIPSTLDLFTGQVAGSIGEVSALAIIIGGLFMIYKKIITWHIPFSFILSSFIFSGSLWLIDCNLYINPLFHIITGGLMLGAFFMATDMVTSPMSSRGMLVYGTGCGLLTILIRVFGAYPEGVSFAILIMNAITPIINILFKPKRFGEA